MHSYKLNHGQYMPIRMAVERSHLATQRRLPGLGSSMLGLEIQKNKLSKIDYEDIFKKEGLSLIQVDNLPSFQEIYQLL